MHQQVWTSIGVCPIDENATKWIKLAIKLFTFAVLVSHLSLILASIMFITQANYEDTLHALSLIAMIAATSYVLAIALIKPHKVVVIFEKLSTIHLKCKQTLEIFEMTEGE